MSGADASEPLQTLKGHWAYVLSVAFSPDGKLMATGGADFRVRLWDTTTWRVIRTLSLGDTVNKVAFSPDGKLLAVAARDHLVSLWAVPSGERTATLPETGGAVMFSPDGSTLATLSVWDNTVRLWDRVTARQMRTVNAPKANCIAFSPDGKTLAIGGPDSVELWDATGRERVHTFKGHWGASARFPQGLVKAVAFSPNGKILATAADDSVVRLWDTTSRRELRSLDTAKVEISSVAFSPDGRWVAAGCLDGTARLWKAATGAPVCTFSGNGDWVLCLAFSPDSKWLVTGNADGTAEVWTVPAR